MDFQSKFNLDQLVWTIVRGHVWQDIPCPTCKETGRIDIGGEEFVCPKCQGRTKDKRTQYKWHVDNYGTVGKITAEAYGADYMGRYPHESPLEFSYMLSSTGIGSGTCWQESRLFSSEELARAECNRRNDAGEFDD
jgi:hypothetical protein